MEAVSSVVDALPTSAFAIGEDRRLHPNPLAQAALGVDSLHFAQLDARLQTAVEAVFSAGPNPLAPTQASGSIHLRDGQLRHHVTMSLGKLSTPTTTYVLATLTTPPLKRPPSSTSLASSTQSEAAMPAAVPPDLLASVVDSLDGELLLVDVSTMDVVWHRRQGCASGPCRSPVDVGEAGVWEDRPPTPSTVSSPTLSPRLAARRRSIPLSPQAGWSLISGASTLDAAPTSTAYTSVPDGGKPRVEACGAPLLTDLLGAGGSVPSVLSACTDAGVPAGTQLFCEDVEEVAFASPPLRTRCLSVGDHGSEASAAGSAASAWWCVRAFKTVGGGGRPHLLIRREDITRRKLHESQLERAVTMSEAKNEVICELSHEILTPMNGIMGMLQCLDDSPLSVAQRELVGHAMFSSSALLHTLTDVLELRKADSGKLGAALRPVKLHAALRTVEEVSSMLSSMALDKGLNVVVDTCPSLYGPDVADVDVITDLDHVRRISVNLIANAIKYTSRGRVVVRVGLAAPTGQPPTPGATTDGAPPSTVVGGIPPPPPGEDGGGGVVGAGGGAVPALLFVQVADTGIGIPKAEQAAVFKEFYRTARTARSTAGSAGLGLALSSRLAALLGGWLDLQSEVDAGSTFTLVLPTTVAGRGAPGVPILQGFRGAGAAAAVPRGVTPPALPFVGERVLVTDPDILSHVALAFLRRQGAHVTVANGVDHACRVLAGPSAAFTSVVVDLCFVVEDTAPRDAWAAASEAVCTQLLEAATGHAVDGTGGARSPRWSRSSPTRSPRASRSPVSQAQSPAASRSPLSRGEPQASPPPPPPPSWSRRRVQSSPLPGGSGDGLRVTVPPLEGVEFSPAGPSGGGASPASTPSSRSAGGCVPDVVVLAPAHWFAEVPTTASWFSAWFGHPVLPSRVMAYYSERAAARRGEASATTRCPSPGGELHAPHPAVAHAALSVPPPGVGVDTVASSPLVQRMLLRSQSPASRRTRSSSFAFEGMTGSTSPPSPRAPRASTVRVLVTDDNTVNRMVVKKLLGNIMRPLGLKCVVEQAAHGLEAVGKVEDALRPGGAPFDLLVTDIEMPVMDGLAATAAIREAEAAAGAPRVPIVALTAHSLDDIREKALAAGCDEFFAKPLLRSNLLKMVREYLPGIARKAASPRSAASPPPGEVAAPARVAVLREAAFGDK